MPKPKDDPQLDAARSHAEQLRMQEETLKAARRRRTLLEARDDLIEFARLTMPHPEDPDDIAKSRFLPVKHHRIIAAALQEVERGNILNLIITMPPRSGKTELSSKRFIPWLLGRKPYDSVIFAAYNQDLSNESGKEVREIMRSSVFKQIFPLCQLRTGSQAMDRVQTREGGVAVFAGSEGSITGKGGNFLICDDLIKNREEADSAIFRNKQWKWWQDVFLTRKMDFSARVIVVMTRWHPDDIIGRITDPKNEFYNEEQAKKWKMLHLPAIALEDDPAGREVGEALWPERFPIEFLKAAKAENERGFSALYQGNPSPEDGDFFKRDWLKTYQPNELPKNLRKYVASDHAVSTAQTADLTCLLPVGVCEEGIIWVLPDVWWRKAKTDDVVEAMLAMMDRHKPLAWWAEKGHISKSIGPFLHKRMAEQGIYCAIEEVTPAKDKQTRAQSIQGRVSMGRVRFPAFMPWWSDASDELLKFPSARHDDFVDALSWIGLGLQRQVGANRPAERKSVGAKTGSIAWVKEMTKYEERARQMQHADGF